MFFNIIKKLTPRIIKDKVVQIVLNVKDPESIRVNNWKYGEIKREYITDIIPGIKNIDVTILNCFNGKFNISIDPLEILYLNAIAKFIKAKKILEIGTFDGNTTLSEVVDSFQSRLKIKVIAGTRLAVGFRK